MTTGALGRGLEVVVNGAVSVDFTSSIAHLSPLLLVVPEGEAHHEVLHLPVEGLQLAPELPVLLLQLVHSSLQGPP